MEKQTKEDIKEDMEMIQTIAFHNGVKQGRNQAISEFKEKLKEIKKKYDADFEATDMDTPYRVDAMFEEIDKTAKEMKV